MSNVKPFCVICKRKSDKLKCFEEKILCKCREILKIRQDNKLTYCDVVVPKEVNEFQKYHTDCYRRFTALPQKYRVSASKPEVALTSTSQQHAENQSDNTDEVAATEPTVHTHSDSCTTQSAAGSAEQHHAENQSDDIEMERLTVSTAQSAANSTEQYVYQYR